MKLRPIQHGSVDSTQARAWAAIDDGSAAHGDLHIAHSQQEGRGTRGASWHSPGDSGLYASAIILLDERSLAPGAWTAAGSLALLDVIVPAGALDVRLKWPNDLIDADGAKLAGVLAEARPHGPSGTAVVLGMGVNVGATQFPGELLRERPVTDLARLGVDLSPKDFQQRLVATLGQRLDQAKEQAPSLSADFCAALALGKTGLRVETPQGAIHGDLEALDLAGHLVVVTSEGSQRIRIEHVTALGN